MLRDLNALSPNSIPALQIRVPLSKATPHFIRLFAVALLATCRETSPIYIRVVICITRPSKPFIRIDGRPPSMSISIVYIGPK
jgi:hypothetical protein